EILVAEAKPALAAQLRHSAEEAPRFVRAPPAGLWIGNPCERVQNRVEVWRDVEAQVLEIVACVCNDRERLRIEDAREAEGELGAAHATGERDDTHRKRSSRRGRTSIAAAFSGAPRGTPRT